MSVAEINLNAQPLKKLCTRSPYGMELVESCLSCKLQPEWLCNLSPEVLRSFEQLKFTSILPKGALLFTEGQDPRGIHLLCQGRVKLSISSSDGKMLILRIAEPGDVLGLSATVSGMAYEATAETLEPCQTNFIKREEFMRFLREHGEASLKVAEHLSRSYQTTCVQIRSLSLSHSAAEKLARLLLEWCQSSGSRTEQGIRLKLPLTHEEVARMIGTSRETVSRLLSDFKLKQIIHLKGAHLIIRNLRALEEMVNE